MLSVSRPTCNSIMKNLKFITFLIAIAALELAAAQQQPVLVKYQDDDGNVRMSIVKDPKWKRYQKDCDSDNENSSGEGSDDSHHDHLHEYARRDGPHEDSESAHEKYNISEEEYDNADVYNDNESDSDDDRNDDSAEKENKHSDHPYAQDFLKSESDVESGSDEKPQKPHHRHHHPQPQHHLQEKPQKHHRHHAKPAGKTKKIVYVYKQPPIIVRPKPTNVYIRSKPIIVQPPPLVVHHPQPKPCNPIIKYQPPNIKLKPVIVKISKPRRTTTTTTACPTTTKKPCRKCRRKPTKKCGRCSRRKQTKQVRPEDYAVYYNQHKFRAPEPAQYVQYKNVKCSDGVLT